MGKFYSNRKKQEDGPLAREKAGRQSDLWLNRQLERIPKEMKR